MSKTKEDKFKFRIETEFSDGSKSFSEHTVRPSENSDFMADENESKYLGDQMWGAIRNCCGDNGPHLIDFMMGCTWSIGDSSKLCELLSIFDEWEMEESTNTATMEDFLVYANKKVKAKAEGNPQ